MTKPTNPFDNLGTTHEEGNKTRKLDLTPALLSTSNARAVELRRTVSEKPELYAQANKMMDGQVQDLIDLIETVFGSDKIQADAQVLAGAAEDQLSRLLESRRSDRSKAKSKGISTNNAACMTYISAMYAELMVRSAWNKPYQGSTGSSQTDLEALKDDREAITRKIKSLQSKKSRLSKVAKFDAEAQAELDAVEADILKLNQFRGTTVTAKTVVKSTDVDAMREALELVRAETSDEEKLKQIDAVLARLA